MHIERTTSIFHYTPKKEYLKSIIKTGFCPRFSIEDFSWLVNKKELFLAFPMVCFCDIPLSKVEKHTNFYGAYGIGLRQNWAVEHGISPITYISHKSSYKLAMSNVAKEFANNNSSDEDFISLLSNIKPLRGKMKKNNEWIQRYFYDECEWRFVPKVKKTHKNILAENEFNKSKILEEANKAMAENYKLAIKPKDIKYILVSKDDEIPDLVNFIESELDEFPAKDLKILVTRISSFESIKDDF